MAAFDAAATLTPRRTIVVSVPPVWPPLPDDAMIPNYNAAAMTTEQGRCRGRRWGDLF